MNEKSKDLPLIFDESKLFKNKYPFDTAEDFIDNLKNIEFKRDDFNNDKV